MVPVFISPFLRDNDPQIHLPAANYILRRVQVQFGWLKPALGRIRVLKPRKSFVVASVCFSLGLGVCLFYALHYQQGEGTAVVLRARFVRTRYEYADVPAEVRIIFEY